MPAKSPSRAKHFVEGGLPGKLRVQLRPHRAGSEGPRARHLAACRVHLAGRDLPELVLGTHRDPR